MEITGVGQYKLAAAETAWRATEKDFVDTMMSCIDNVLTKMNHPFWCVNLDDCDLEDIFLDSLVVVVRDPVSNIPLF